MENKVIVNCLIVSVTQLLVNGTSCKLPVHDKSYLYVHVVNKFSILVYNKYYLYVHVVNKFPICKYNKFSSGN